MKKTFRKVGCAALAVCSLAVGAMTFTSCTTSRPEVEMQLSFNGETYTLQYTLYRKMAPNTVNHFLALAQNGYYDGLCVHNYTDSKWYTGGYSYDAATEVDGGLTYRAYFDTVAAYQNFPVGIWKDEEKTAPTYTLYGEFSANDTTMQNGDFLAQSFGALTMYYTAKEAENNFVYVQRVQGDGLAYKDYKYNSATSLFSISMTDASADSNYCTFATLNSGSVETLETLQSAVSEYISTTYGEEGGSFTNEITMEVSEDDFYVSNDGLTETYAVPEQPIVIQSVKVKKY